MSKKQKKMLVRIITAAVILIALYFIPVTGILRFALYLPMRKPQNNPPQHSVISLFSYSYILLTTSSDTPAASYFPPF